MKYNKKITFSSSGIVSEGSPAYNFSRPVTTVSPTGAVLGPDQIRTSPKQSLTTSDNIFQQRPLLQSNHTLLGGGYGNTQHTTSMAVVREQQAQALKVISGPSGSSSPAWGLFTTSGIGGGVYAAAGSGNVATKILSSFGVSDPTQIRYSAEDALVIDGQCLLLSDRWHFDSAGLLAQTGWVASGMSLLLSNDAGWSWQLVGDVNNPPNQLGGEKGQAWAMPSYYVRTKDDTGVALDIWIPFADYSNSETLAPVGDERRKSGGFIALTRGTRRNRNERFTFEPPVKIYEYSVTASGHAHGAAMCFFPTGNTHQLALISFYGDAVEMNRVRRQDIVLSGDNWRSSGNWTLLDNYHGSNKVGGAQPVTFLAVSPSSFLAGTDEAYETVYQFTIPQNSGGGTSSSPSINSVAWAGYVKDMIGSSGETASLALHGTIRDPASYEGYLFEVEHGTSSLNYSAQPGLRNRRLVYANKFNDSLTQFTAISGGSLNGTLGFYGDDIIVGGNNGLWVIDSPTPSTGHVLHIGPGINSLNHVAVMGSQSAITGSNVPDSVLSSDLSLLSASGFDLPPTSGNFLRLSKTDHTSASRLLSQYRYNGVSSNYAAVDGSGFCFRYYVLNANQTGSLIYFHTLSDGTTVSSDFNLGLIIGASNQWLPVVECGAGGSGRGNTYGLENNRMLISNGINGTNSETFDAFIAVESFRVDGQLLGYPALPAFSNSSGNYFWDEKFQVSGLSLNRATGWASLTQISVPSDNWTTYISGYQNIINICEIGQLAGTGRISCYINLTEGSFKFDFRDESNALTDTVSVGSDIIFNRNDQVTLAIGQKNSEMSIGVVASDGTEYVSVFIPTGQLDYNTVRFFPMMSGQVGPWDIHKIYVDESDYWASTGELTNHIRNAANDNYSGFGLNRRGSAGTNYFNRTQSQSVSSISKLADISVSNEIQSDGVNLTYNIREIGQSNFDTSNGQYIEKSFSNTVVSSDAAQDQTVAYRYSVSGYSEALP